MFLSMLKSKIHRATVTGADLNYIGSITVDAALLEAARLLPNEKVHVVNINNGTRFETYVIPGEKNSGVICLNGAAARLVQAGDIVIIISYCTLALEEASGHKPAVVLVDSQNAIKEVRLVNHPGEMNDGQ